MDRLGITSLVTKSLLFLRYLKCFDGAYEIARNRNYIYDKVLPTLPNLQKHEIKLDAKNIKIVIILYESYVVCVYVSEFLWVYVCTIL